jgi:Protein of unknown function/AsmA-like C-terminal region
MIRTTGRVIHHTSKVAHRLLIAATGFLVVTSVLLAAAAWRLSQGPIELVWLSDRLKAILSDHTSPVHVSFDSLLLAWEGFHKGVDYPLDLRVTGIEVADPMGKRLISAPQANVTFSAAGLLLGRFVPRTIDVNQARIAVTRELDGTIGIGGSLTNSNGEAGDSFDVRALRDQLARPAGTDYGRNRDLLDQIRRVHLRDTEVTISDQNTGLVVKTDRLNLDILRPGTGHVTGVLNAPLSAGDQQAELAAHIDVMPDGDIKLDITLSSFRLAGIGALPPALAATVPVSFDGSVAFDRSFGVRQGRVTIRCGEGIVPVGRGQFPLRSGIVELSGTPDALIIEQARFNVSRSAEDPPATLDIGGTVTHTADRVTAVLTVAIDQIDIADLPRLWPVGVSSAARSWVVQNVTGGTVRHGSISVVIEADDALKHVAVTKATGGLDGFNGVFTWIDNVPPVEQTDVRLHLVDPGTLDIHIPSARQRIANGGADLLVKDGRMRITGLTDRDQFADISVQIEGPVASAWTLLKEPRLHLLSKHPIGLKTSGGDVAATLTFQFPLEHNLEIDDVVIHADAHVKRVRLVDVVYGRNFDDGTFDLNITKEGLSLKGRGLLAAIPLTVTGTMDFNDGPGDQVVQKITASGQPDAAQLDAAGLTVTDLVTGPLPMKVVLIEQRSGKGSLTVEGDLTPATLKMDLLAWSKLPGSAATATATILLNRDRLSKVDRFAVRGDGLLLAGSAGFTDGQIRSLLLDRIRLGQTDARGAVHFAANTPVAIVLRGSQIDLVPKLTEKAANTRAPDGPTTPAWTLDGRFDRAILAHGERANDLLVKAAGNGDTIRSLDAIGAMGTGAGFSIKIEPQDGKRHLRVASKDAGSFLRGLDIARTMQSGLLTINATFERPIGYRPLIGTLDISDVTVKNSPVLGKLLQAITLYGLVDALRGPGMGFTRIRVPFQYDGTSLYLDQARANNSSLGLTAKGSIALSSGRASITGTIVPIYFFNAMLGRLPLVGKLFSPEDGGGLFAARFGVEGLIDDPSIWVNPVSTLTPGFLRGIFGVFDSAEASGQPPGPR